MNCTHNQCEASVHVNQDERGVGSAVIRIDCKLCGMPFQFTGLPKQNEIDDGEDHTSNAMTVATLAVRPAQFGSE